MTTSAAPPRLCRYCLHPLQKDRDSEKRFCPNPDCRLFLVCADAPPPAPERQQPLYPWQGEDGVPQQPPGEDAGVREAAFRASFAEDLPDADFARPIWNVERALFNRGWDAALSQASHRPAGSPDSDSRVASGDQTLSVPSVAASADDQKDAARWRYVSERASYVGSDVNQG